MKETNKLRDKKFLSSVILLFVFRKDSRHYFNYLLGFGILSNIQCANQSGIYSCFQKFGIHKFAQI